MQKRPHTTKCHSYIMSYMKELQTKSGWVRFWCVVAVFIAFELCFPIWIHNNESGFKKISQDSSFDPCLQCLTCRPRASVACIVRFLECKSRNVLHKILDAVCLKLCGQIYCAPQDLCTCSYHKKWNACATLECSSPGCDCSNCVISLSKIFTPTCSGQLSVSSIRDQ